MADLPNLHNLTSAQTLCMLTLQEAQLRCEAFPDKGAEIAARIRDLMFDRKKLIDRAQPL